MSDPQDLVSVYQAADLGEAHFVKNLLAENEIDCRVSEQNEPLAGLTIASHDLLVRRVDEPRARSVVGEFEAHRIERASRPDWHCPACAATVLGAYDECDNCGAAKPGSE